MNKPLYPLQFLHHESTESIEVDKDLFNALILNQRRDRISVEERKENIINQILSCETHHQINVVIRDREMMMRLHSYRDKLLRDMLPDNDPVDTEDEVLTNQTVAGEASNMKA